MVTRNVGLEVPQPKKSCDDPLCPFHGSLPVRRKALEGKVVTDKMNRTVVVERDFHLYLPKYMRYEKRRSKISAHCPPCLEVRVGDGVRIAECRPLSKEVSFVVVERMEGRR